MRSLSGFARLAMLSGAAWLATTVHAHADYLWLQRDGGAIHAYTGELHKQQPQLPDLQEIKVFMASGQPLPVKSQANELEIITKDDFGPAARNDLRLTTALPGANGVLTYYQAKLGRQETQPVHELELVPTQAGGNTFQLFFKNRPVAASQVNVDTAQGWRRQLSPNTDGTVTLDTPFPGLYVLEVTARVDKASTTFAGKSYQDVRYTTTLSFEVSP